MCLDDEKSFTPRRSAVWEPSVGPRLTRAVGAAALTVLCGCPEVPTQTGAMEAAPNVTVSARELELQAFALGRQMPARIVIAADSILAASTDPAARRHALEWKVGGVPLVQEAALR